MNRFLNTMKETFFFFLTLNNALTHYSSGDACLDLFREYQDNPEQKRY